MGLGLLWGCVLVVQLKLRFCGLICIYRVVLPHFPCSMFGITDQEQLPFHVALSWNDRFSLRLFSEFYVWSRQGLGRVQETGGGEHAHQAKIITGTLFGTLLIGGSSASK